MKTLWCWRCKAEMPMLDEAEYTVALGLYRDGIRATQEFRKKWQVPLKDAKVEERFQPLLAWYEKLTGFKETNENAVMHHRLSLYGPPCARCGKPLRTPKAKLCGACMLPAEDPMLP
jgi:hypothetical protein